jgi:hypothetical protein
LILDSAPFSAGGDGDWNADLRQSASSIEFSNGSVRQKHLVPLSGVA